MDDVSLLSILRVNHQYTVTLQPPGKGPSSLAGSVSVSDDDKQDVLRAIDDAADAIQRQTSSNGRGPDAGKRPKSPNLTDLGRLLYGLFLPRPIQDALRDLDTALVLTTNDPELPWELLHDGDDFLSLKHPLARQLLLGRPTRATEARSAEELTFLLIADPTDDLPNADAEITRLIQMLNLQGIRYELLRGERATYLNVQQALQSGKYHLIHYTGHADFNAEDPEESALRLAEDRRLPAHQIEGILAGHPLVFLNACTSGRESGAKTGGDFIGAETEGLAASFIAGGAAGFIGTQWPVFDESSRQLALAFYGNMLAGAQVGEALRQAKEHLRNRRPREAIWAAFVLYGDPLLRVAGRSPAAYAGAATPQQTPGSEKSHRASERPQQTPGRPHGFPQVRRNQKETSRRWPEVLRSATPWLVVTALLIGLIGGGAQFLRGRLTSTPPAATPTGTSAQASPAGVGAIASPTETPQPSGTSTAPPSPTLTVEPTHTVDPSTILLSPPSEEESTPAPRQIVYDTPNLLSPADGAGSSGQVVLRWRWEGELKSNEYFDVRVWRQGQPHYGVAWAKRSEYSLSPSFLEPGRYFWSIAVIRGSGGQVREVLSDESQVRSFTWTEVSRPRIQPTDTPAPLPTATFTSEPEPPTPTDTPDTRATPTEPPTVTPTDTPVPTDTPTPVPPTATPTSTPTPEPPTPQLGTPTS